MGRTLAILMLLVTGCAAEAGSCDEGQSPEGVVVQAGQCQRSRPYAPSEVLGVEYGSASCAPDPDRCAVAMPGQALIGPDAEGLRFEIIDADLNPDGTCPLSCD